jgi:anti-anti-sigma regulatory factor
MTVRIIGQLRAPATAALRRAVTGLLDDGERDVLLDLTALTDIDADGIGELVHLSNLAAHAGGSLLIAGAGASVRRLLDGVDELRIVEDTPAPGVRPPARLARPFVFRSVVCFMLMAGAAFHPQAAAQAGAPRLIAQATRTHLLGLVDVYTIALYGQLPFNRAGMLSADVAKALRIEVAYQLDLRRPRSADWYHELVPPLDTPAAVAHLRGTFAGLRRDDVVLIEYVPGTGTSVRVNKAVVVSGAHHELMLAFLDHWVGQRPVSEEIKGGLLND